MSELTKKYDDVFSQIGSKGVINKKTRLLIVLATSLTSAYEPLTQYLVKNARGLGILQQELDETVALVNAVETSRMRFLLHSIAEGHNQQECTS